MPVVKGEVVGIADSGGTVSKIVKHATQQIEKSVVRASAELKTLLQNKEDLNTYNIETQPF